MMKALILAAGLGTRLAPLTNDKPKSLVAVNNTPIIFKQIKNLKLNGINDITIVSGYKHEILKKAIHENWPDVNIIESIYYATTNNMYSAYLGIQNMFSRYDITPFLMMNADVFFDESVIYSLLDFSEPNAVVVDIGRYINESMKVVEKEGRLIEISKIISPKDALGSSIDVYKFSADGGKAFFEHCVGFIEKRKDLNKWSEAALNEAFSEVIFRACPLKGRWLEIDNHEDLAAAEALFDD